MDMRKLAGLLDNWADGRLIGAQVYGVITNQSSY